MKRSLLHLLLPGLLWAAAIFAETGPELVKRRMPQFYEAWVTVAGEPAAHRYFADWDEAEVQFLEKKFETILRLTAPDAKATPPTDTLFERFNGTVLAPRGRCSATLICAR